MKSTTLTAVLVLLLGLCVRQAWAEALFIESFDYGETDMAFIAANAGLLGGWSGLSNYNIYDADGGLTHSELKQEIGGAFMRNYDSANSGISMTNLTIDFLAGTVAGDEIWMAGLIAPFPGRSGTSGALFDAGDGTPINDLGYGIDAGGNVIVYCSDDGDSVRSHDTGIDVAEDGIAHLFIIRATFGTGDSPVNSTVDFWFDPSDTSSVGVLGAPNWTTGADSKFGRRTVDTTYVALHMSIDARDVQDEVRLGRSLEDVVMTPPPPTGTTVIIR